MRRRHDPFLKLLYREGASDAVRLFFPNLAARIDWAKLKWIEKEVPIRSPRPRSVVADLVGETQDMEGRYLKVLIHPELQMEPDDDMGWRVTQYNVGLLLQEAEPNARVLTFVFYHCPGVEGIQKLNHRLDFYDEMTLDVGYWSVGLSDLDAEQYAQSENPMAWALAAWMRQRRQGRVELRLRLLGRILQFVRDEVYRWLLLDTVRTYFRLNATEQVEEQRLLESVTYGEVREMFQTELGKLEEAAERRTLQRAVLHVLHSRFPVVPESIEARIRAVRSIARLEALLQRAATSATPEELWPPDGR